MHTHLDALGVSTLLEVLRAFNPRYVQVARGALGCKNQWQIETSW